MIIIDRPQSIRKIFSVLLLLILTTTVVQGQSIKMFRAAIVQDGTKEKVQDAVVENLRTGMTKKTDGLGVFEILSSIGDSLMIYKIGYEDKYYTVTNFEDARIYIKLSHQLLEVNVNAQKKASAELKETSSAYSKQKGILYEGKPPIALLSPFGGSPVTFFYELFSKDAKRVRRLNQLAANAVIEEEIARRFNAMTIKAAIPIKDDQIIAFRDDYTPKVEELRTWSDFQVIQYIKESFNRFNKKK